MGMGGSGGGGTGGGGRGGTGGGADARPDLGPDTAPDAFTRETNPDVNAMTADTACATWANNRCAKMKTCTNGDLIERDYGTEATCQAQLKEECKANVFWRWTGDTPMRVMACATAVAAQSCSDFFTEDVPLPACAPPRGYIEDGGTCIASEQCYSAYCRIAGNSLCGVCRRRAMAGENCAGTECVAGFNCVGSVCVSRGTAGAGCNASDKPCGAGTSCVGATMTTEGACQRFLTTVGAACDTADMRTLPQCDSRVGLYCKVAAPDGGAADAGTDGGEPDAGSDAIPPDGGASTVGACARNTWVDIGGVCNADGSLRCRNAAVCNRLPPDGSSVVQTGVCGARVGAGLMCNTRGSIGPACIRGGGLRCVEMMGTVGTCTARDFMACP